MAGGKRCWTVLMVLLLVGSTSFELGWCWGDAVANAKEHLNIAANWAQERFSGGAANVKETADGMTDKAANTASGAAGAMNSAASDASKYASQKADQVGGMVNGGEGGSRRSSLEVEAEVEDKKFDQLQSQYDDTVKKVGESYHAAKDTISDKSKQTYESAKEMASDAASNVGDKMTQAHAGEL